MKLRLINLFLLFALQTLCFSLPVQALNETFLETIKLDESFLSIEPRSQILYLEDNQHTLQKEDILNSEHFEWLALPNPSANFGFSDSVFWLKFSLQNTGQRLQELYLHIDYALLDKINVYQANGNKLLSAFDSGDHLPFQNRPVPFPTFLFPINIESGSTSDVYIRIETQGTLQAPISIWNKDHFLLDSHSFLFLYGCFLSAMLIMSAYNLCLFFTIRDKNYLIYSVFILLATGVHSSLDGFAYQWFWPTLPDWHQISAIFFIATGCFVSTVFTQALLPIPKKSRIKIGISFLMVMTACSALMSLVLSYRHAAMLNASTTIITMLGVILVCLAMVKHSPNVARYFILAWGTYFAGIILKSSSNIGFIDSTFLSEYAGNIGAVCAILIMSLALAERITNERLAKEKAQLESINHLSRFQSLYENALEGVFTFNLRGRLLSANPAFYKLMGVSNVDEFNAVDSRDLSVHQTREHRNDNSRSVKRSFKLSQERFQRLLSALKLDGRVSDYETQINNQMGFTTWINVSARLATDQQTHEEVIEGTLININERKAVEEQLKHLANHDSLTGLVNRRAFENAMKKVLNSVKENKLSCCLLYLDLDQFKIVNDLCGHSAGDLLLKILSLRLYKKLELLNKKHIISRLGSDEFGIILNSVSLSTAKEIAEQFRQSVDEFLFVWGGQRFSLGVSIGLVELCPFHQSIEQVLVMADTACYLAKDQGRNRVHTFIESDQELEFRQLEVQWVTNIKEALLEDSFFLVFQDIVSNQKSIVGYHYEILLRLINKQGNLCGPGQFLPAAERYNLMPNIDRWVINHFFSWLNQHPEHLKQLACASINLSTTSIGDDTFSSFLTQAFEEYSIPHHKICFEITESMAITHIENTHTFIDKFHHFGCRFALDDFGTGFSSYAYLKELQVDYLKIDGLFIKNLSEDAISLAMVKSISDVASAIGIETIAEFVETEEVRKILTELGINYSQGYHLHKPVKLDIKHFDSLLNQQT
jgi:diguanylate cyclase (GGDEF)-like protein/PAS domain S-box-containing protein